MLLLKLNILFSFLGQSMIIKTFKTRRIPLNTILKLQRFMLYTSPRIKFNEIESHLTLHSKFKRKYCSQWDHGLTICHTWCLVNIFAQLLILESIRQSYPPFDRNFWKKLLTTSKTFPSCQPDSWYFFDRVIKKQSVYTTEDAFFSFDWFGNISKDEFIRNQD